MHPTIQRIAHQAAKVILGKETEIRLSLACILARGHLLIEDVPGVGKTSLAHVLAKALGLNFQRIQFTSDLLPADILGIAVYERETGTFKFHPGPIFSQVVLADEVNRATPKTQSALLEAMEEHQVTLEGATRKLPEPFFVIATQNPVHQIGTFPLPESQLDRFLLRIELGYPNADAERELLKGTNRRGMIDKLDPVISPEELIALQNEVDQVHASDALIDYIQALVAHTRQSAKFPTGLSPRAGLSLLACARAWAFIHGRNMVLPEDVQAVLSGVVTHRLRTGSETTESDPASLLLKSVPLP